MHDPNPVTDRAAFAGATALIESHGEHAALEAALRAEESRDKGNVIHFCRWRQIERTIDMLQGEEIVGALH